LIGARAVRLRIVEFIEALRLAGFDDQPVALQNLAYVFLGENVANGLSVEPSDRMPEDAREIGIDQDVTSGHVLHAYGRRHGIDNRPQQRLAFARKPLGLLPLRDVEAYAHDIFHAAGVVAERDLPD
jgi:hypothetical protein